MSVNISPDMQTCTAKKQALAHLHKCSTMKADAQRDANALMISALQQMPCSSIARGRLKLLCKARRSIHASVSGFSWV